MASMATQSASSSTSKDIKKRKRYHSSCLEEDEKIITSYSSSSSTPRWKYDVLLSFYGKDTRTSFTDHLYVDLKWNGILIFRDDETLKQGEYISQALPKAIQESQFAIVIFSTNYASSKWCLMELAKIVEWEEKTELTVFPIFYRVDPSDVRNQTGSFAEALAAHEEDLEIDVEKIRMWKDAFRKVGSIVGWHIHDRYESMIIQEISGSISRELNSRFSRHDYDKLVAIDSHVEGMMKLLDMESNDVRFVGIHGMGGIGKTTLAEIIYDRVSNCRFEGSSFISCIREKSTTARDLASLQKQLLSTIMQEEIHVWDHHQGIRMIMKMLQNKRVFIVLDDVDSEKQLTALAGNQKWFGPGSRVIITCRDSHLLRTHGVYDIYKVKQLQAAKALQLFILSAFKKTHSTENYMDLSKHFVKYAQGLPLALKVLGSFLFGRTMDAWESARDQLEAVPNKDIINILQLSFEGLEDSQKKLFLDMACFFQEEWLNNNFKEILKSFGYYPDIDIDILVDKSLISKSKYERLFMHDLLKKMGQEIVRRECPEELGRRSRLFRHEDVFHVLKNDTGTDAIEGVVLDFCPKTKERLNAKALSRMRKLRYFEIHHSRTIKWHGDPLKYMPTNELRFLEWSGYHLKSLSSSFQPKNLTVLRFSGSRIKQLWKGSMVLDNLKYLTLSDSENLIETPDLTGAPNLEKLYLSGCRSLCEVHPSIRILKRLKLLDLSHCESLERLPDKFCLKSLEYLVLDECSSLEKLPDQSRLECLKYLIAYGIAITQIPSINLFPKSINGVSLKGGKWMPGNSRDPTYDIGSLVEYQMEGKYEVKAMYIDIDREGENILDIVGGGVANSFYADAMIYGWSLGSGIPDWVHNTSNGSSVKMDLDGNMKTMGCAFFIVCDFHQFLSTKGTSISSLFKESLFHSSLVEFRFCFETGEGYLEDFYYKLTFPCLDVCLVKPIGFCVYITAPRFLERWKLDKLSLIKISITAKMESFSSAFPPIELQVKECGVHLVSPNDANSQFYNSIAPHLGLGSSNLHFYRRFYFNLDRKPLPSTMPNDQISK